MISLAPNSQNLRVNDPVDWSAYHNFTAEEFFCPCCGEERMSEDLICALQTMREDLGAPIVISKGGGYRCHAYEAAHGRRAGGAHPAGMAVDILACLGVAAKLMAMATDHNIKRIGVMQHGALKNRFLHFDIADSILPSPRVWTYKRD